MCEKCIEAVKTHFPDCPDDAMGDFLFVATPWPFGGPDDVTRCLARAQAAGCTTYQEAMAYANYEMDCQMRASRN